MPQISQRLCCRGRALAVGDYVSSRTLEECQCWESPKSVQISKPHQQETTRGSDPSYKIDSPSARVRRLCYVASCRHPLSIEGRVFQGHSGWHFIAIHSAEHGFLPSDIACGLEFRQKAPAATSSPCHPAMPANAAKGSAIA